MAPQTETPAVTDNPYRLSRVVVPRRYDLTLEPDLPGARFAGSVEIAVDITAPVGEVVLNAAELDIDEAWVVVEPGADDGDRRVEASVSLDPATERATLALASELPAGIATVHLRFRGTLNDKLQGFYRSTFTDSDGTDQVLACTQMEATDARKAFPCWDEPDFKAVFGVTLVVDEGLLAISNGGELSRETTADGRVAIRFADTIPMSTYLVAFVVGPLEATDAVAVDGTALRVVHPPGKGHLSPFALEVGAFCLRYFTDWFALPYPADKLDLVAVPDFAFGAMENLGCVTFRERLVLVDPETATQSERQAVVDVIAHEIAHMWFGDLVTMKWWNGIWLNEAFATFMEMKATDAFRPDWQRWVDFGLSRSAAFDTDALASTRPIEFPVVSPDDAEGMFDILTYEKGASVVRMLEQYLGEHRFREGIRRYMRTHQLGNTETTDLWDALEEETGEPVRRIADSWIFQGGFPEILVSHADGQGPLRLSQQRFSYGDGDASEASPAPQEWAVPVTVGWSRGGDDQRVLLDQASAEVDAPGAVDWVNANRGANGFYRVRYSPELLDRLVENRHELSPLERYALVDDTWAAVLGGSTAAATFLELAEGFAADETDLSVWERLVGGLSTLERLLDGEPRSRFAARVRELLGPARDRLGAEPRPEDDDRTRTLRGLLVGAAAAVGDDDEAIALSRARLDAYLADPTNVEASLASAALSTSAALGDDALHGRLVERFRSAGNPQDRERFLFSLARFHDPDCLARTLELSLAGEVRTQDAPYLLGQAIGNRDNGEAAWAFVARHWPEIVDRFPDNSIPRLIGGIRVLRERAVAHQVAAFLAEHPVPQGELMIRQHLERMWVTVALAEREAQRLAAAVTRA
ncbi:MAG: M1 family metallopeptidase [Acidimicrobiales bacterium]